MRSRRVNLKAPMSMSPRDINGSPLSLLPEVGRGSMSAPNLPKIIRNYLEGALCEQIHVGKSSATVFRVIAQAAAYYLKVGEPSAFESLESEAERLRWLQGRAAV